MLSAQMRAQMSYRTSFWIEFAGSSIFTLLDMLTVIVLFSVTKTLGSFAFPAAFLMASLASCGFALADLATGNIERLREGIRTGQIDALLVRPLGLLRQLLVTDFALRRAGRAAQSLVALGIAAVIAHTGWSVRSVVLLVLTPLAGFVFFASVFVIAATVSFWWIDSGEFSNAFTDGGRDFATYPITVYGQLFRRLFAFGFGFAFVAYYPTLAILDLPDPLGLPTWFGWMSPLVAAVVAGIAAIMWRIGIRHYRSTGS
jgi:ABC-2 type transport system permease protein